MNHPCPDCNSDLTPSIVGYLCSDCGAVHSFQKISDNVHSGKNTATIASSTKSKLNQNSSQAPKKGIRHKLKNFVVPRIAELPKPIDESHLIGTRKIDTSLDQTPLGPLAEPGPSVQPDKAPELVAQEDYKVTKVEPKSSTTKIIILLASITLVAIIGSIIVLLLNKST